MTKMALVGPGLKVVPSPDIVKPKETQRRAREGRRTNNASITGPVSGVKLSSPIGH
jgi:hypothetical protein